MSESDTCDMPFDDESTLENARSAVDPKTAPANLSPKQIGPYKILAKLGEGGFGIVYEAQQESPIKRRVALKIIKPGMDSQRVIARFEAERQALALMTHPNISKVLGGGLTEQGLPYFVMELVRGEPITEFCDRNKMTLRDRLKLLIPVCHAIQHAHSKAVIHRDIKPSNILVGYDTQGHPWPTVIDFGVAKALNQQLTDKTIFTSEGQMIGTPEYMSPEQAEMSSVDIDTRTDVYSLGVVMYELLTGMLPFEPRELRSKMYAEMQRIIREEDPPRPSNRLSSALSQMSNRGTAVEAAKRRHMSETDLPKRLRGELDWIVMKCLEKDRDRRYSTPTSLAEEIGHYLDDEPVLARPPSTKYRLGKLVRRNRAAFISSLAFVALLICATGVSVWFSIIASRERQHATVANEQTESALIQANERLSQVQSLVRIYSDYEKRIRRLEGATSARERLAGATMGVLNQLSSVHQDEPWIKNELANSYLSVGNIRSVQKSNIEETIDVYQRAMDIFHELRTEDPTNSMFALGEAQSATGLASSIAGNGKLDEAMNLALRGEKIALSSSATGEMAQLRARTIWRAVLAQANLKLLSQDFESAQLLASRVIESDGDRFVWSSHSVQGLELKADAYRTLGQVAREQGDTERAINLYDQTIKLRGGSVLVHKNDAALRRGLIQDLYVLGRVLAYEANDPQRAISVYRESLEHAEHLRSADPMDGLAYELVLEQRRALATVLRRAGLVEKSLEETKLLVSVAQDYASQDPLDRIRQRRVVAVQFDYARALNAHANRLLAHPDTEAQGLPTLLDALKIYRDCSDFYTNLIQDEDSTLGTYDKYLIDAAEIENQHAFAIEKLGRAQGSSEVRQSSGEHYLRAIHYYTMIDNENQLANDQRDNLARAYRNLGTLALERADGEQAVHYFELADQSFKKETVSVFMRKAEAYRLVGDEDKCRMYATDALKLCDDLPEEKRLKTKERIQGLLNDLNSP